MLKIKAAVGWMGGEERDRELEGGVIESNAAQLRLGGNLNVAQLVCGCGGGHGTLCFCHFEIFRGMS